MREVSRADLRLIPNQDIVKQCNLTGLGNTGLFDFSFLFQLFVVMALAAAMYFTFAFSLTNFSRAEVFFSECAREMLQENSYITPLYHAHPFFDKPILMYWLILLMFKTIGVSQWAARVPSILASLTTIAISGIATTALYKSRKAGLFAAMVLATACMYSSFSYLCMSDVVLVMFNTSAVLLLYAGLLHESNREMLWWIASIAMGLAFLTKGPVGIILPIVLFATYLLVTRRLHVVKLRHVLVSTVTVLLIATPWFVAICNKNGIEALAYFFVRENLQRFAGATYDTHKPVWYTASTFLTGFLPWSILLPFAISKSFLDRKERHNLDNHDLYLWLWVAVVTIFFSLSRGKCDYYVLPAYPAAAALTGVYLSRLLISGSIMAKALCLLFVASFLTAGIIFSFVSPVIAGNNVSVLPIILFVAGLFVTVALLMRKLFVAYFLIFSGICISTMCFTMQVLPVIVQKQPVEAYSEIIKQSSNKTLIAVDLLFSRWIDQLTFVSAKEPIQVNSVGEFVKLFKSEQPVLAIMPINRFYEMTAAYPSLAHELHILDKRKAISHALTPAYLFEHYGNLYDVTLVLVANQVN